MGTVYSVGDVAKKLRKSEKTLQKWDRDGVFVANRTPTGRRFYTHEQILSYFGLDSTVSKKAIIAYCRVSSAAQKPDLANQVKALTQYCLSKNYEFEIVDEVGGGMNFKRPKFKSVMTRIKNGEVSKLIIAHKDRLTRFGFDYLAWECEQSGTVIEILNDEQMSPEHEMVQDLMTIVHCFSSRLYGLRNYKKELKKKLEIKSKNT
jgi:predicted site-specific integrase-resolvase